jgi:predicted DCC family thiol-disulfide oxidoreductase YuxK
MSAEPGPGEPSRLVVFDGYCNVCSSWARFFSDHPLPNPFLLVPMQSALGRGLLTKHGFDADDPLTFLVLDHGRCYTQSDAAIHLYAQAGGLWRLAGAARVVPRFLRDAAYRLLARNRYRWFGRRDTCFIPGQPAPPPPHAQNADPAGDGR